MEHTSSEASQLENQNEFIEERLAFYREWFALYRLNYGLHSTLVKSLFILDLLLDPEVAAFVSFLGDEHLIFVRDKDDIQALEHERTHVQLIQDGKKFPWDDLTAQFFRTCNVFTACVGFITAVPLSKWLAFQVGEIILQIPHEMVVYDSLLSLTAVGIFFSLLIHQRLSGLIYDFSPEERAVHESIQKAGTLELDSSD